MELFTVKTEFIFTGNFSIRASTQKEANELALKQCGMNSGEIHSTLDDKDVNWNFDMTPEQKIVRDEESNGFEDEDYPLEDWRYEVTNIETLLSYSEWVLHKKESEEV